MLKLFDIEGMTLTECILQGKLKEKEKNTIITEVIRNVSIFHMRGIIHRDLKPDNIIVSSGRANIIDFGSSTEIDSTHTNYVGTPRYRAPEVVHNNYTSVCDVYSIGMIIYFMETGRVPYEDFPDDILQDCKEQGILPEFNFITSPYLKDLIQMCIDPNPVNRIAISYLYIIASGYMIFPDMIDSDDFYFYNSNFSSDYCYSMMRQTGFYFSACVLKLLQYDDHQFALDENEFHRIEYDAILNGYQVFFSYSEDIPKEIFELSFQDNPAVFAHESNRMFAAFDQATTIYQALMFDMESLGMCTALKNTFLANDLEFISEIPFIYSQPITLIRYLNITRKKFYEIYLEGEFLAYDSILVLRLFMIMKNFSEKMKNIRKQKSLLALLSPMQQKVNMKMIC